ncbi:uncharacterized protein LOC109834847 [Asparagus officinalis]|nr:uncharacterized protein LOC109834847 [Asparagus officinalis]
MNRDGASLCGPRCEVKAELKRLNKKGMESVWVRVRRGGKVVNLRARVAAEKRGRIHRSFTIRAARDDRHVAVLADLTLDECSQLQEMSRTVVNTYNPRFDKNKGITYDWKKKVGTYLPDRRSTVISSILFLPFSNERSVESTTTRCMAWFTSAVSSGVPLVFVNIQTEQALNSGKYTSPETVTRQLSWKELSWGRQQSPRKSTTAEMVQGIRLWFLPGISEVPVILTIEPDETRFGMDIKRTDEARFIPNSNSQSIKLLKVVCVIFVVGLLDSVNYAKMQDSKGI